MIFQTKKHLPSIINLSNSYIFTAKSFGSMTLVDATHMQFSKLTKGFVWLYHCCWDTHDEGFSYLDNPFIKFLYSIYYLDMKNIHRVNSHPEETYFGIEMMHLTKTALILRLTLSLLGNLQKCNKNFVVFLSP